MDIAGMLPTPAFRWIFGNIKKGSTVLELGSGFGSEFLSMFYEVYSVENDPEWVGKFPDVHYIHAPIVDGWYDPEAIRSHAPALPDLLILDGPLGSIGRTGLLDNLDLFDWENVPVLIDDLQRPAEAEIANVLCEEFDLERVHFDGGPRSWGVFER